MGLLHKKNQQKNKDPFIRLLTPMIAGILACVFCLVSLTWAWFTASVDTETQTIEAAVRSTSVTVYEITNTTDENGKETETREVKMPVAEGVSLLENTGEEPQGVTIEEEPVVWELSLNKSYEVIMTGDGTASKGYCKVALSHTVSGSDTAETKLYKTPVFEKEASIGFTYHTGGFAVEEGVTETSWNEYVNNAAKPTLTIASYWGNPEGETAQVSLMSVRETEEYMLLSDGDVLGFAPIPCPEAKAETEMDLVGFEMEEGTVISAEEDYQVSLTLKEGYEMPAEVVVNIDGKDYFVSTSGAEANEKAPYYDAETGILTVPAALLHDGATVYLQAEATPIPEEPEEEREEETEEETTEETETEETPAAEEPEESLVTETPAIKEEDEEEEGKLSVKPVKPSSGKGDRDENVADSETEDDAEDEENADSDSTADDNTSDEDDALAEARNEKIDVTFTLAQLTIDLEKTNLPANADLVLTLAAKEGEEYPEQFVITLDKTVRDEENEDEEIEEDKTDYTINVDGEDNPEGFAFDAETGELTIESELLVGVRAISIADGESEEAEETEEEAILPFEVKNLTFAFGDAEFALEEDMVILFTAGEGYELPETIIITIDDEEYVIYTSEDDSEENPEGITFDAETGTLTISKELLEDAETISIAAEAVKVEDDEEDDDEDDDENGDQDSEEEGEGSGTGSSEDEEEDEEDNTTEGGSDPGDDDDTDTENGGDSAENEGGDSTGTEEGGDSTESGDSTGTEEDTGSNENASGDNQDTENGDATEGENGTEDGDDTGETDPETQPDDTTEGDNTEGTEDGTDAPATTNPEEEEGGNEQGGEGDGTEENGENENGTDESTESTPGTEGGDDDETTTPAGSDSSATIPDAPETGEPASGDNAEIGNTESSGEGSDDSGNGDSTLPSSAGEAATLPSLGDAAQSGGNTSDAPAPASGTDSQTSESPSADTTSSGSKETSSEEE